MGYLARNALIFLFFSQSLWLRPIDYLIKLLGSLPTLILGNAVIVVSNRLDFHPTVPMASMAFIVLALAITGLPTILQIGREVLKDYDPKQLQQALALGIGKPTIGKDIIIPGIRRSFNAGITIAISRIIIEGYIVINRMVFMEPGGDRIIRDPQDFLDIFYGLYSTVTIETNATLIVLLFIIALSVNFLSFRVMSGKLP
jgi:ABC-type phosphate transport system permease subunit